MWESRRLRRVPRSGQAPERQPGQAPRRPCRQRVQRPWFGPACWPWAGSSRRPGPRSSTAAGGSPVSCSELARSSSRSRIAAAVQASALVAGVAPPPSARLRPFCDKSRAGSSLWSVGSPRTSPERPDSRIPRTGSRPGLAEGVRAGRSSTISPAQLEFCQLGFCQLGRDPSRADNRPMTRICDPHLRGRHSNWTAHSSSAPSPAVASGGSRRARRSGPRCGRQARGRQARTNAHRLDPGHRGGVRAEL